MAGGVRPGRGPSRRRSACRPALPRRRHHDERAPLGVASAPLAAIAAVGCYVFWPVHASGIRPLEWYAQTLIISLPGAAVALRLETGRSLGLDGTSDGAEDGDRAATVEPTRTTRGPALPTYLVEAALCLQMEDHHVRVHTAGRSRLHLAPLRQVAEELGPARGMQVHRSWWVARHAVRGWREERRSIMLVLTNGQDVPVARNRVADLRAGGWLTPGTELGARG